MMIGRRGRDLADRLTSAEDTGTKPLKTLPRGLRQDFDAVTAGLGPAGFALLRPQVLVAGQRPSPSAAAPRSGSEPLPLDVARDVGRWVAHPPGPTMRIVDLCPGGARTDARDAFIVADAAREMPHTSRSPDLEVCGWGVATAARTQVRRESGREGFRATSPQRLRSSVTANSLSRASSGNRRERTARLGSRGMVRA